MKRLLALALLTLVDGAASAQTFSEAQRAAALAQQAAPVRVNVSINIFVPTAGSTGEQALADQEKARRQMYQFATKECLVLTDTIATDCKIETLNVNVHRQQGHQQAEGINVNANVNYRVTLK